MRLLPSAGFTWLLVLFILIYIYEATPVRYTKKNKPYLLNDGYEYRQQSKSADGTIQFWVCASTTYTRCPGRLWENLDDGRITVRRTHIHGREQTAVRARQVHEDARALAAIPNLPPGDLPPRTIYGVATRGLNDEELAAAPSENAIRLTVQRTREIPETAGVDKPDQNAIVFAGFYTEDYEHDRFLLYDSREHEPNLSKMFVFATEKGLSRLRENRLWASDGTYKIRPANIEQIYILSAIIDGHGVPCIYVFMNNKDEQTYRRLFTVINQHVGGQGPQRLMTDFEDAAIIASQAVWPHVETSLCLFHLSQSLQRRVQNAKLTNYYHSNQDFRVNIRRTAALAALPPALVERAFRLLRNQARRSARRIIVNFGHTYIRTAAGNDPRFPINTWNMHDAIIRNYARTNNAVESNNRVLRDHFRRKNPKLSKVIKVFKYEENLWQQRYRRYSIDRTSPLVQRERPQRNTKERKLKQLVQNFDLLNPPSDNDIMGFLTSVNNWLYKKKFDRWDDWTLDDEAAEIIPNDEDEILGPVEEELAGGNNNEPAGEQLVNGNEPRVEPPREHQHRHRHRNGHSSRHRDGHSSRHRNGHSSRHRDGHSSRHRDGHSSRHRDGHSSRHRDGHSSRHRDGHPSRHHHRDNAERVDDRQSGGHRHTDNNRYPNGSRSQIQRPSSREREPRIRYTGNTQK